MGLMQNMISSGTVEDVERTKLLPAEETPSFIVGLKVASKSS